MKAFISALLLFSSSLSFAQPDTEIYLFTLKQEGGKYTVSNPKNISDNEGYDNQPSFWPDGESIIYARTVEGQTEIARYSISSGKTEVITNTKQGSEYSPTPMPDGRISSIRLDTTGLQRLYAYELDGTSEVLVPDMVIGYHAWISKKEVITFVLGEPATMQLINTKNGKAKQMAENIGRSLHKMPHLDGWSYVDKTHNSWGIKTMDSYGNIDRLAIALEGSEDYCWTAQGDMIMGQGSKLFFWTDGRSWTEFVDLAEYGLKDVTRMATSWEGDQLVVVVKK